MEEVKPPENATTSTTKRDDEPSSGDESNEPRKKIPRLQSNESVVSIKDNSNTVGGQGDSDGDEDEDEDDFEVEMNEKYTDPALCEKLQQSWKKSTSYTDEKGDIQLYGEPFRIGVLQNFLADKRVTGLLVNEMGEDVEWSHKQMDLYEFDQTKDLSKIETTFLKKFLTMLKTSVQPWLEKLSGLKLTSVSASCSMYNCGDYLLVHDDLLKDRQIAFVYYLSPWEEIEQWTDDMGGCLEIFKTDENYFPHFPVVRKINPRNNQFVFFKVGSKSFHQVGEVTTNEYPRMTINGWFHGDFNNDQVAVSCRPYLKIPFRGPQPEPFDLLTVINKTYLEDECKKRIQTHIEDNSEICLEQFFQTNVFQEISDELKTNESLVWTLKGPASAQRYEVLDVKSATDKVMGLVKVFKSAQMFKLLQEYTDLDLVEPNANKPRMCMELQRWTPGCYTVLGDTDICDENTLDLMFFLNASEDVGVTTYLSPEEENDSDNDESVLLTITPKDNALNIVYRCEGTTKFTKYVSKLTPIERGPAFILCCSYKE